MRNSRTRFWVGAAATVTLASMLAACSSERTSTVAADCEPRWEFDTVEEGFLTVIAVNNPPSISVNPDSGEAEGFDTEILPGFAQAACLDIRWLPLAGAPAVAAMTEGKGDLGSGGWAITEERGEVMGQFEEAVYWNGASILSKQEFTSMEQLKGLQVGVEGGSLYQEPVVDFLGEDNVRIYQSVEAEIGDLNSGRLDAIVAQAIQTIYQADRRGMTDEYHLSILPYDERVPTLTEMNPSNYPFTKSNVELGEAIQEYIAEMKESGELAEILGSYGLAPQNIHGPESGESASPQPSMGADG